MGITYLRGGNTAVSRARMARSGSRRRLRPRYGRRNRSTRPSPTCNYQPCAPDSSWSCATVSRHGADVTHGGMWFGPQWTPLSIRRARLRAREYGPAPSGCRPSHCLCNRVPSPARTDIGAHRSSVAMTQRPFTRKFCCGTRNFCPNLVPALPNSWVPKSARGVTAARAGWQRGGPPGSPDARAGRAVRALRCAVHVRTSYRSHRARPEWPLSLSGCTDGPGQGTS